MGRGEEHQGEVLQCLQVVILSSRLLAAPLSSSLSPLSYSLMMSHHCHHSHHHHLDFHPYGMIILYRKKLQEVPGIRCQGDNTATEFTA